MKNWKFDREHSQLYFKARYLMITSVYGFFEDFNVEIKADTIDFEKTDFKMEAAINSVKTMHQFRDKRLKDPDFFDAESYSRLSFSSRMLQKVAPDSYRLKGVLCIKSISKEVSFALKLTKKIKDPFSGEIKVAINIQGEINRRDFGILFSLPGENGIPSVSNSIEVGANIVFVVS